MDEIVRCDVVEAPWVQPSNPAEYLRQVISQAVENAIADAPNPRVADVAFIEKQIRSALEDTSGDRYRITVNADAYKETRAVSVNIQIV